jgi:hypothetical protein
MVCGAQFSQTAQTQTQPIGGFHTFATGDYELIVQITEMRR